MKNKSLYYLILTVVVFSAAGASCPNSRQIINDNAPIVLSPESSMEDVIRVVNANSARIQKVQSTGATLTVDGMPQLSATYAFERPRRFRLRAETGLTGAEVDLGSNDQTYWMWVKRSDQPAVYWGRHEQFHHSAARSVVPVPPDWLIEALGVVQLDPTAEHQGPDRARPGHLQIRSRVRTPNGDLTKITILDDQRGWVVEQHVFDATNQPLAVALASGFQYDPVNGVSLPRQVEIRLPPAGLNLTMRTERHLINQIVGDGSQLWAMPRIDGFPYVDLADPSLRSRPLGEPLVMRSRNQYVAESQGREYRSAQVPRAIRRLPPFDRLR